MSASRTDETRWLTITVVSGSPPSAAPRTLRSRMAWCSAASVLKSSAEAESSMIRICGEPTRARAMVLRWRWPPLSSCRPPRPGRRAPAACCARTCWPALCRAPPRAPRRLPTSRQVRLLRMVPLTSDERCGTVATTWRSWSSGQARTSAPITLTLPVPASYRRGISETSVDLPLPVPPRTRRFAQWQLQGHVVDGGGGTRAKEKAAWSRASAGIGGSPAGAERRFVAVGNARRN